MNLSLILASQVSIVFILIILGFILTKLKIFNDKGAKQVTDILLLIVTPAVIINAYQKDFQISLLKNLGVASFMTLVIHAVCIVLSYLVFRKEASNRYRVERFAGVYSNCGFMAIPLLNAALGSDGVFFGSAYLMIFTILYWTIGVYTYTEDKKELSLKKAFLNPGVVGTVISLTLFFFNIRLPYILSESVTHIANLNTPLAMIVLGKYLTEVDFKKILTNISLYKIAIFRLIAMPLIFLVLLKILYVDDMVAKSVLISSACPAAAVTTLFANKYHLDATFAAEAVAFTTVLSIVTIPLILTLA